MQELYNYIGLHANRSEPPKRIKCYATDASMTFGPKSPWAHTGVHVVRGTCMMMCANWPSQRKNTALANMLLCLIYMYGQLLAMTEIGIVN